MAVLQSQRLAWLFSLFYFATFGGFVAFSLYLPKLLIDLYKITPIDAGNRVLVFVVLATLARPTGGWLSDRWGAGTPGGVSGGYAHGAHPDADKRLDPFDARLPGVLGLSWPGQRRGVQAGAAVFRWSNRHGDGVCRRGWRARRVLPTTHLGAVRQAFGSYTVGFALLALTSLICFLLNQRVLVTSRRGEQLRQTKLETR